MSHKSIFLYSIGEDSCRDTPGYNIVYLGPQDPCHSSVPVTERGGFGGWQLISATPWISEESTSKVLSLNEIKQLWFVFKRFSRDSVEFLRCQIFTMCETVIPNSKVDGNF